MALSFLYLLFVHVSQLIRFACRGRDELAIEVVMLRHEVSVLRRQIDRPALRPADGHCSPVGTALPRHRRSHIFVQPDTLLRWHHNIVRPPVDLPASPLGLATGTVALVVRLAKKNSTWGYRRSTASSPGGHQARPLEHLGHLEAPGPRALPRGGRVRPGPSSSRVQAKGLLACGFFSVDTVLLRWLYDLFLVGLDTQSFEHQLPFQVRLAVAMRTVSGPSYMGHKVEFLVLNRAADPRFDRCQLRSSSDNGRDEE